MSIADKITRLQTAKTNIATAITNAGGTVNSGDGFEDFATDIGSILLDNTVRFIGRNNSVYQITSVNVGNTVSAPTKNPAGFLNWKYDLSSSEVVSFPITPTGDVIIYGQFRDALPVEYQEVEYLQSNTDSISYIDSGIKAEGGTDFEVKYQVTNTRGWAGTVGCRQQSGGYRFWNIYNGPAFEVGLDSDHASGIQCNTTDIYVHKLETTVTNDNDWNWIAYYGVNTDTLTVDKTGSAASNANLGNLSLFGVAYTNEGTVNMNAYGLKMYYCKMWQTIDGVKVLVRHFIPCYRKSDSEPGMYDLINNVFYDNDGIKPFLVGPNLN